MLRVKNCILVTTLKEPRDRELLAHRDKYEDRDSKSSVTGYICAKRNLSNRLYVSIENINIMGFNEELVLLKCMSCSWALQRIGLI